MKINNLRSLDATKTATPLKPAEHSPKPIDRFHGEELKKSASVEFGRTSVDANSAPLNTLLDISAAEICVSSRWWSDELVHLLPKVTHNLNNNGLVKDDLFNTLKELARDKSYLVVNLHEAPS